MENGWLTLWLRAAILAKRHPSACVVMGSPCRGYGSAVRMATREVTARTASARGETRACALRPTGPSPSASLTRPRTTRYAPLRLVPRINISAGKSSTFSGGEPSLIHRLACQTATVKSQEGTREGVDEGSGKSGGCRQCSCRWLVVERRRIRRMSTRVRR